MQGVRLLGDLRIHGDGPYGHLRLDWVLCANLCVLCDNLDFLCTYLCILCHNFYVLRAYFGVLHCHCDESLSRLMSIDGLSPSLKLLVGSLQLSHLNID